MKIIEVTHSFFPFSVGGRQEYVMNLVNSLSSKHKIKIYTTSDSFRFYKKKIRNAEVFYFPCIKFRVGHSFYRIPFLFFQFLMREDFDIIHAHDFLHFTSLIAAFVSRLRQKPLVITEHGYYASGSFMKFLTFLYKKVFVSFIANSAKKVIVASHFMKEEVSKKFGIPKNKIEVIYPGIDVDQFKLGRSQGYILFIGRIVKEKGLHLLINAISNEKLVVVGPVEEREYFEKVRKASKGKNVVFKGKVKKEVLKSILSKSDFVVIPSLYEPFGIVAVEALASGKPVLASATGGLKEIINKKVGMFFEPGNSQDLRNKIDEMGKKKFNTKKLLTYAKKFDLKKFANKMEKIYRSII